jgi:cytochrome c biogenesis protein CcmG/thiol:disulfide interchange protein DsbE
MSAPAAPSRRRLLLPLIPLAAFLALAGLFYVRLGEDTQRLPSALVGRPAPQFTLPPLPGSGQPGFADADLRKGHVTIVNVFASWCGPCRDEHPYLMQLAADEGLKARGVRIAGLAYKDEPSQSLRFLRALGNPYDMIGVDRSGRVGVDWGVYGVPETFVVRGDGSIAYKYVGPIDAKGFRARLGPAIAAALKETAAQQPAR